MKVWALPPDWVSKSNHRIRVKSMIKSKDWETRRVYMKGLLASIPSDGGVYIASDWNSDTLILIFEKENDALLYALKWGV